MHRDLKPSNVLLDRNLSAKVGDVGLACLMPSTPNPRPVQAVDDHSRSYLTQLTECAGTSGYIDPEYLTTGYVVRACVCVVCVLCVLVCTHATSLPCSLPFSPPAV